jgi:hypothetical protein
MLILLVAYLLTEVGVLHDKLYCKSENIIGANSKILPLVYVFFFLNVPLELALYFSDASCLLYLLFVGILSLSLLSNVSVTKIKVLDACGPPGLPNLLSGASEMAVTTVISALSFAPDGEVYVVQRPQIDNF